MPNTGVDLPIHVVAAVIWHPLQPDTLLITQRTADRHLAGYWELPGGKKECGEEPLAALKRELLEEVGIDVVDSQPMLQVSHDYPDKRILLDVWQVSRFDGVAEPRENQAMVWVTLDQLHAYEFPAADIPVLEALRNGLQGTAG